MYKCNNCSGCFETPDKICESHGFKALPFEIMYVCPYCKSGNFSEKNQTHCRCCGARLSNGAEEYCSSVCRNKGERLWKKQAMLIKKRYSDPLHTVIREMNEYNKTHSTEYSYGQFVALIRPKLKKEATSCEKRKKDT